ncbi:MAG: transposase [Anaerolineae bacterium]|jgi:hypothetical protein
MSRLNPDLTRHDELGVIYEDSAFATLFGTTHGRLAESPGYLALGTVLQFTKNLSDRQAANAARARPRCKYLLVLALIDPGFDHTLLHEFRQRLLDSGAKRQPLDVVLELFRTRSCSKRVADKIPI